MAEVNCTVFSDVTPCILLDVKVSYELAALIFYPENWCSTFLRNVYKRLSK
jgi:hypothetical protein